MQRGLILLLAALGPSAIPAAAPAAPASPPVATRGFTITSFDRIRLEAPFAVTVASGAGASARAEGPDRRMLERVRIDMMGRTLVIRRDDDATAGAMKGIRIAITTPAVAAATVLGAGSLTVTTRPAARFDAVVSGAGSLTLGGIDADMLNVTVTGAGGAKLTGCTRTLRAVVQGAGTIDAPGLSVQDAGLVTAGTGTVKLTALRTAKVNATGGGTVTILGTPACTVASEGTVEVTCTGPARH